MTDRINSFISGETTLDEISISELEGLIADFPYADTFKVLLAKKMNSGASHSLALQRNDVQLPSYHSEGEIAPEGDFKYPLVENELEEQIAETVSLESVELMEYQEIVTETAEIEEMADVQKDVPNEEEPEYTSELEVEDKEVDIEDVMVSSQIIPIVTENDKESSETEDLYFESDHAIPKKKHKKSKKNKSDKFALKEYSGISDFSKWLLAFKKDDVEKKIKKEEKAARKKKIEDNARKSVTKSSAIISEPLAEILASQGHLDDAKKMYEQLMHKYPEKSSYFAAKINNLIKI